MNTNAFAKACRGLLLAAALTWVPSSLAAQTPLQWDFTDASSVVSSHGLEQLAYHDGCLTAHTQWDAFIHLKLPEGGVNAKQYGSLRVRLYSSAPAEHLAVLYQNAAGQWALGLGPAIQAGWAIYQIDLNKDIAWGDGGASGPEAKQWGGEQGHITALRIDPSNSAGRRIAVDWVTLEAPGGDTAVFGQADWNVLPATHGGKVHSRLTGEVVFRSNASDAVFSAVSDLPLPHPTPYNLRGRIETSGDDADAPLTLHVSYRDILGHELPKTRKHVLPARDTKAFFTLPLEIPDRAATVAMRLTYRPGKSGATLHLNSVSLRQRSQDADSASEDAWRKWGAHWIWLSKTEDISGQTGYFRHSFDVKDPSKVISAVASVTADNACRVSINGHELPAGSGYDNWTILDQYDLMPFLRAGTNIVGVTVANHGGPGGLIGEVAVRMEDGSLTYIPTDSTWQRREHAGAGWTDPTTDRSEQWEAAVDLGAPPVDPWGDLVPYFYTGPSAEYVVVEPLKAPSTAKPGKSLRVRVRVRRSDDADKPVTLMLSIAPNLVPGTRGIVIGKKTLSHLTHAEAKTVEIKATVPAYLPPGRYYWLLRASSAISLPHGHTVSDQYKLTGNGALASPLTVVADAAGPVQPQVKLVYQNDRPVIDINGRAHTLLHYMNINARLTREVIRNSRNNGIHLYFLAAQKGGMPGAGPTPYWAVDRMLTFLLEEDPKAHVVLAVALYPSSAWMAKYPDQLVRDAEGETYDVASLASRKWLDLAKQKLGGLIDHVQKQPYAQHVIGYMPCSGETAEWQYWRFWKFVDYSPAYQQRFQQWLEEKYGTIAALNAAWQSHYDDFSQIPVPTPTRQKHSDLGDLLDPAKSRDVIDVRHFHSLIVARDILDLARVVKKETNGQSLCGVLYGYGTYVLGPHRFAFTGHFATRMLLNSPDIDFLMSPARYQDRGLGGASGAMPADGSLRLHDKVWIDQADIRTVNSPISGTLSGFGRLSTLSDTAAVIQREFARTLVTGGAYEIFDFGKGWTAGDPRLMQLIGRMRAIEDQLQKRDVPNTPYRGRQAIAFIHSNASTFYTASDSGLHQATTREQYPVAYHSGVGVQWYLLSDLDKIADKYQCFVFLNTVNITPAQRRTIDQLKRDGNVLVFVYAPGVTDGKRLDVDLMAEVTGFKFSSRPYDGPIHVKIDATQQTYGTGWVLSPLFVPQGGHVVGQLVEKPDLPGLVIQRHDDWTAIYSAATVLPPSLLQKIAHMAGVRVTNPNTDDVTYVGNRLFAIHTVSGGKRRVTLAATNGKLVNPFTHKETPVRDHTASITVPPRSTSLFLVVPDRGQPAAEPQKRENKRENENK